MHVTVKICGLTSAADARAAVAAGADFVGFVFFPASKRCLGTTPPPWIRALGGAKRVGVFRDQDEATIRRVREEAALELVQLHGSEPPSMCETLGGRERVIKAVSVGRSIDWGAVREYEPVARILFDTASPTGGGSGRAFDWELLAGAPGGLGFWVAGGLTPANVRAAVRATGAAGVDVASGVEAALGRKDVDKMRRFVAAARDVRTFGGDRER